jgi:RHS repeat-associated protein
MSWVITSHDVRSDGNLDERLWVVQDANWNVTALIDNSGAVVERYIYDPFGSVTVLDGEWNERSSGSEYAWVYLHQGGRFDVTSGLYHFRHRDYSPTLGRWTTLDPLRYDAGDVNLYRTVFNAPTVYTDPSGLWTKEGVIAILKETPDGTAMLKRLAQSEKEGKLRIFKADLRYKYTYDENAKNGLPYASPETKDWIDTMSYGFVWKDTIYLHNDMTDFIAAWTLIHEGTHFYQTPRKDYSRDENIRIEYEAFLAEAKWLAQKQEWITEERLGKNIYNRYVKDEEFFKKVGNKCVVNEEGIKKFIIVHYIDRIAKPGYRQTKYAYEGPPIQQEQISGWSP